MAGPMRAEHVFVRADRGDRARGGNVVLNFMGAAKTEMALVAKEYFEAAKFLMSSKVLRNDLAAYPIVFLYRHAVELYIKAILIEGDELSRVEGYSELHVDDPFKHKHKLSKWLDHLSRVFEVVGYKNDEAPGATRDKFRKVVEEIDPCEEMFRYTLTKKMSATADEHFVFSPAEMARTLDPILDGLDNVWLALRQLRIDEESR